MPRRPLERLNSCGPAGIYDQVCEALTNVATKMPMGVWLDENNVLGPLQNKALFDIVAGQVQDAEDTVQRRDFSCQPCAVN